MARLSFNIDPNEVNLAYRKTKLFSLIDEFIESGADIAEVCFAENEYKGARSCVTSLLGSLKKRSITSVRAMMRSGKVYLIRKD